MPLPQAYEIPQSLPLAAALLVALPALSDATRSAKSFQFLPQKITKPAMPRAFCKTASPLACLLEPIGTCGALGAADHRQINMDDKFLEVVYIAFFRCSTR